MNEPLTNTPANIAQPDAWAALKQFTNARIAVGRTGNAIPLAENLQFRADHASARDAVHTNLDVDALRDQLSVLNLPILTLHSEAGNRQEYLRRPDKGRKLRLTGEKKIFNSEDFDVAFIVGDGLSAKAVQIYTQPFLHFLVTLCSKNQISVAPVSIVQQARVAIGDEIGMMLNAKLTVVLIGERPGLSSPHSMGIYITYKPVIGLTDESRYCISNIHTPGGLSPENAATQAFFLIRQSLSAKLSGVHAKIIRQLQ